MHHDLWEKYRRSVYNLRNLILFEHSFSTFPVAALVDSFTHHAYKDKHFLLLQNQLHWRFTVSCGHCIETRPGLIVSWSGHNVVICNTGKQNSRPITTKVKCGFIVLLCCECCILSFGWFPGVWILCRRFGTPRLFHLHRSCEK